MRIPFKQHKIPQLINLSNEVIKKPTTKLQFFYYAIKVCLFFGVEVIVNSLIPAYITLFTWVIYKNKLRFAQAFWPIVAYSTSELFFNPISQKLARQFQNDNSVKNRNTTFVAIIILCISADVAAAMNESGWFINLMLLAIVGGVCHSIVLNFLQNSVKLFQNTQNYVYIIILNLSKAVSMIVTPLIISYLLVKIELIYTIYVMSGFQLLIIIFIAIGRINDYIIPYVNKFSKVDIKERVLEHLRLRGITPVNTDGIVTLSQSIAVTSLENMIYDLPNTGETDTLAISPTMSGSPVPPSRDGTEITYDFPAREDQVASSSDSEQAASQQGTVKALVHSGVPGRSKLLTIIPSPPQRRSVPLAGGEPSDSIELAPVIQEVPARTRSQQPPASNQPIQAEPQQVYKLTYSETRCSKLFSPLISTVDSILMVTLKVGLSLQYIYLKQKILVVSALLKASVQLFSFFTMAFIPYYFKHLAFLNIPINDVFVYCASTLSLNGVGWLFAVVVYSWYFSKHFGSNPNDRFNKDVPIEFSTIAVVGGLYCLFLWNYLGNIVNYNIPLSLFFGAIIGLFQVLNEDLCEYLAGNDVTPSNYYSFYQYFTGSLQIVLYYFPYLYLNQLKTIDAREIFDDIVVALCIISIMCLVLFVLKMLKVSFKWKLFEKNKVEDASPQQACSPTNNEAEAERAV